jgi:hypothetical protein
LFSPIGDRYRVIREEAAAVNWLQQLIGKLRSIGRRKTAPEGADKAAETALAAAEAAKAAAADAVASAKKAESAKESATESAESAKAAVTESAESVEAAADEVEETAKADAVETAEAAKVDADAAKAEAVTKAEPAEPAKAEPAKAEAKPAEEKKPAPADPALSTLDQNKQTAELAAKGPYGAGSAKPAGDGTAPSADFTVKAKESSKLFHTEKSPYFSRTKADVWFKSEADAESAGFQAWDHKKRAAAKK